MIVVGSHRTPSFRRLFKGITDSRHHIGDDVFFFDDYTVNPILGKPFRTDCTIVVQVLKGNATANINRVSYQFSAPCLIVLLAGQVVQYEADEHSVTKSRVVAFSDQFMMQLYGMSLRMNEIFSMLLLNPVINLTRQLENDIDLYVRSALSIASYTDNPHRLDAFRHLTFSLFYGSLSFSLMTDTSFKARSSALCNDFFSLVRANVFKKRRLDFYASELCITRRYLGMVVSDVTGRTPAYWIDYHLISEAKRLLSDTGMSIQQICEKLNFPSQSSFGKYFKRLTSMSPLSYRKSGL